MSNKVRDTLGKFAPKSMVPRKIRSVNLTDEAWQWLATVADKAGMSRNDYLEALAEGNNPLMETAKPQVKPFIEMAQTETKTDDASTTQQPDSELLPLMETVQTEVDLPRDEVDAATILSQLRAKRKKSPVSLADIEAILEIIEES